jgi:hypothetical protein
MQNTTLKITKGIRNSLLILILIFYTYSFAIAENALSTVFNAAAANNGGLSKAGTGEKTYSKDYDHKIEGEYSEKFVLAHGDCGTKGYNDCNKDRQRIERRVDYPYFGKHVWYKFSFYLDKEWDDETMASIAQVKIRDVRPPAWQMNVQYSTLNLKLEILGSYDSSCNFLLGKEDMKGKWNQVVLYTNYSDEPTPWLKNKYMGLWINGKQMQIDNCDRWPILGNEKSKYSRGGTSFRYGIYQSYVSNELNTKAIQAGVDMKLKGWTDKGGRGKAGAAYSMTNKPWKIDWPVKLKTKRIWFDDMDLVKSEENIWNMEVK